MARSQSHTLGEFLGTFFEDLMRIPVRDFAISNGLFFDSYGKRNARAGKKKVTWTDVNGSKHDLDFVIEKGGTENEVGQPVAFIELAWRRYTKHSKNKVQEIQGAVNPICEKYRLLRPFKGAILSGQFTEESLHQLRNDGFHVLYVPFEKFISAFKENGLDVDFDEDTSESELKKKYLNVSKASNRKLLVKVREFLLESCKEEIGLFVGEMSRSYFRKIKSISILPLHGEKKEVDDIDMALLTCQAIRSLFPVVGFNTLKSS